jgi:four helix bundle protein
MTPDEMKKRLKSFALRCIRLAQSFPRTPTGGAIGGQLIDSATSAAANYRAACLARSRAEFAAKIGIVVEEADESVFWIDIATDAGLVKRSLVSPLMSEGSEILKIAIASRITAKASRRAEPPMAPPQ